MVSTRKLALVVSIAAAMGAGTAIPALGAFSPSDPNPLRIDRTIRVQDVATDKNLVAVGWREGSAPGALLVAYSRDGGASFLKSNGRLRMYPVAGTGKLGLALDVCEGVIWAGSAAHFPGDADGDTDVLISRRTAAGVASQAFVTLPPASRRVLDVDVACVGTKILAITWLEKTPSATRARLLLRDQASLSPASTKRVFNLGEARPYDGIAVAATPDKVFVTWSKGNRRDLRFARLEIGSGKNPDITRFPTVNLATRDAIFPSLATRGDKVVVAYSDDGQLKAKMSTNAGESFGAATLLLSAGTVDVPSRPTSVSLSGPRIVIEAMKKQPKDASEKVAPVRLESPDNGANWSNSGEFGNRGARFGALKRVDGTTSLLKEAWHDNGPTVDIMRMQREVP